MSKQPAQPRPTKTMTLPSYTKLPRTFNFVGAGLAAWQMKRGRSEAVKQKSALHLSQRLGKLRGIPQKVGQLLSMSADRQQAEIFSPLTESAQALPFEDILPIIEAAWGEPFGQVCVRIEKRGHAASLGQVHRATLLDGREVAIKVQYPGMHAALEADLSALGWIAAPIGNLKAGFDLAAYQEAMRTSLQEELDYSVEASNQTEYAHAASDPALHLVVPKVVGELSSDRVLTTIWESGASTSSATEWSDTDRMHLGKRLLTQFLSMLFDHGLIHADPHSGNYRFRRGNSDPSVVLYDYGCVHRMDRKARMALLRLISDAADANSSEDPFPLFVALGFDADLLRPLRHKLPAVARILFQPFGTRGNFDLSTWNLSERISDVLGDDRLNFRVAGPASMLFFLRAFHGLLFHLGELDQPISWWEPFRALCNRHAEAMKEIQVEEASKDSSTYAGLANKLCICVHENGSVKAKVSLPASTVERLDDFIDDEVRAKIETRGIDVPQLIKQIRNQHYAPQSIFELIEDGKTFAVWLE